MGREVRRVPKDWKHPKRDDGSYEPLCDNYMPDWPEEERTHYIMYEDVSEGTPISPAFETPEQLARWLADNKASSFGNSTATYEQWLRMILGPGWCASAVLDKKGFRSGVEL